MPMFEGSVPSNLSFKKGCDESYLKNMHTLQQAHTKINTPHVDTVSNGLSHKGENQKSKTVSPFITACSGLSRMGQVQHRHTQSMW